MKMKNYFFSCFSVLCMTFCTCYAYPTIESVSLSQKRNDAIHKNQQKQINPSYYKAQAYDYANYYKKQAKDRANAVYTENGTSKISGANNIDVNAGNNSTVVIMQEIIGNTYAISQEQGGKF